MNKSKILALMVTTIVASPAFADDGAENDTIIVIATRTPTSLAVTPAPVSVVTADELQDRQSQSAFDALKFAPGINVGGGPRQQGEMPAIRGFDRRQIIITVDGARRNTTRRFMSIPVLSRGSRRSRGPAPRSTAQADLAVYWRLRRSRPKASSMKVRQLARAPSGNISPGPMPNVMALRCMAKMVRLMRCLPWLTANRATSDRAMA
jgi:hypothetical protein